MPKKRKTPEPKVQTQADRQREVEAQAQEQRKIIEDRLVLLLQQGIDIVKGGNAQFPIYLSHMEANMHFTVDIKASINSVFIS